MQPPNLGDLCSDCEHRFSDHYVTFDSKHTGCYRCTSFEEDQRDGPYVVGCKGYAIRWKYHPESRQMYQEGCNERTS